MQNSYVSHSSLGLPPFGLRQPDLIGLPRPRMQKNESSGRAGLGWRGRRVRASRILRPDGQFEDLLGRKAQRLGISQQVLEKRRTATRI
jgi:hypothetical protein